MYPSNVYLYNISKYEYVFIFKCTYPNVIIHLHCFVVCSFYLVYPDNIFMSYILVPHVFKLHTILRMAR